MSLVYNTAKRSYLDGTLDLTSDTINVMLVTSAYSEDADDVFVDDGGANDPIDEELSGTGYVAGHGNAGRLTFGAKAFSTDLANDRGEFDNTVDATWTGIDAGTAEGVIVFREGTSDDTDALLIAYIDTGGFPAVTNGGDLTIQWNAEGILHAT